MTQTTTTSGKSAAFTGAAYMVLAGLIFAVINVANTQLTWVWGQKSTTVTFWEYFIALLFSLPWVFRNLRTAFTTSHIFPHIARVALAAGGVQLWVLGFSSGVPLWQMIALLMTSPFFVTIGSLLVLGETVTKARWLSLAIGFAGAMIILSPWSDTFTSAVLYPLGASFLWAMYSLITKHMTKTENPDTLTLYLLLLLTPINAGLTVNNGGFSISTDMAIALVVVVGVLVAVAQYLLVKAYSIADAAYLQPFDYVKQPVNIFLGWLVYNALPEGIMWLGTALIIGASIYLLSWETKR